MKRTVSAPFVLLIVLVGLSLLSVAIFEGAMLGAISTIAIVLIAALKSRIVILHYMEAKHAPARWRFLYQTWNFAAAATIIIGYCFSMPGVS